MLYKRLFFSVQGLSKTYTNNTVLENISFSLSGKHIVGLVGPNGIGKSTLARILAGKSQATDGHFTTNGEVGYLAQELHFGHTVTIQSYLRNFVESREDYKIDDVLKEVGLEHINRKKLIAELSGGQQRKLAFAKLLLQEKTILLLDEPTNHLDADTKDWLYAWMNRFEGMIIVISHDRALLNQMCDGILELNRDKTRYFDGNYDSYKEQAQLLWEAQHEQYLVYEKRKKKMEAWLARIRQRASVYADPAIGRMLRNKEKYFDREITNKSVDKPLQDKKLITHMHGGTHTGKLILSLEKFDLVVAEKLLISNANVELRGKQRVLLSGVNGSGKTSLLKAICDAIATGNNSQIRIGNDIHICYIDQHQLSLVSSLSVLDEFMRKAKGAYTQSTYAKSVLVQFGFNEHIRHTKVADLSYGQRVRLIFAQLSTHTYDLLILDEPTNHLDIPTREAIEQALIDYEGALLIVSHDEYFVGQMLIDTVWEIDEGKLVVREW